MLHHVSALQSVLSATVGKGATEALCPGIHTPLADPRWRWLRKASQRARLGQVSHLPDRLRDPQQRMRLRQWSHERLLVHACDTLRRGLLALDVPPVHAGKLVQQMGEVARHWLMQNGQSPTRPQGRQALHKQAGQAVGRRLAPRQWEPLCRQLSEAWLLVHIKGGYSDTIERHYVALQKEIRYSLAYGITKDTLEGTELDRLLFVAACNPSAPSYASLSSRLEQAEPDTAQVVRAYRSYFQSVLKDLDLGDRTLRA